ncbi:hypothetical protein [Pantoea sp. 1.19]|uniref:hypothetical protein n=1 Tax=Pantoea sp. 1.19 TaxID=1925589 RepID=UPI000948A1B2|nr:hypothetical protein [Pantoea sp. 1.19]
MHLVFPDNIAPTDLDATRLADIIRRNTLKIESRLNDALGWYSGNAQIVPGSFHIIAIEVLNHSGYRMSYEYRWQVFNACLDIDATEVSTESVTVSVSHEGITLDFIAAPRPSPGDEL